MTFLFVSAGFFLFSLAYATLFVGRWLMDGTGGLMGLFWGLVHKILEGRFEILFLSVLILVCVGGGVACAKSPGWH